MNNAGLPRKPTKVSQSLGNDIPIAQRDTPEVRRRNWVKPLLIIGPLGLGAIALIIGMSIPISEPEPTVEASPEPTSTVSESEEESPPEDLLGHFEYKEAPASELKAVTADGRIKLRSIAAQKYQEMLAAARADGVNLSIISGFRSVEQQQHLFFGIKAQRGEVAAKRAEVSAPPGYSEHHTGYAVDLGDANAPATNLSPKFENTAAFKWLERRAPYYSFELSFPKDNPQGISYEPWHWRFVGDTHSLETFYKAQEFTRTESESE
ncbi:MAG: D-alanyl-D-alanine carboxypeptidase family protein [Symploca sp. SIO1B1]|nr:D-alanyl-D-alanine carboxypeptidase family protein [Symploca sp. SIO1A3]NER97423.1 D-alanyl-D-alanine carboxypeptidase family protein [Symploca sp. SIO1B1]